MIAGVPLVLVLAGWLAGRRRSLPTIALSLAGAQLGLHAVFDYAASIPAMSAGHTHHESAAGHAEHAVRSMTATMAAGHIIAGLVAAWWLHRGEAALWAHCATLAAAAAHILDLVGVDPAPIPVTPPRASRQRHTPQRRYGMVLRHIVVRRGPPLPALAP